MTQSVRQVMPPTLAIPAFASALNSGEFCFWPRTVPMMNWKSVSDAMLQVWCRVIHFGTLGFAVLTSESRSVEEIGIMWENNVLRSVRKIILVEDKLRLLIWQFSDEQQADRVCPMSLFFKNLIKRWTSWPGLSNEFILWLDFQQEDLSESSSEILIFESTEFSGSGNVAKLLIY